MTTKTLLTVLHWPIVQWTLCWLLCCLLGDRNRQTQEEEAEGDLALQMSLEGSHMVRGKRGEFMTARGPRQASQSSVGSLD